MRLHRISVLLIVVAAAAPSPSRAAGAYQATATTQVLWYGDALAKDVDQGDLAQYLRANAKVDEAGRLRAYGYGRFIYQPTTGGDADVHAFGRLYYLYLDYRGALGDRLDLRLGRAFVPQGAIPGVVDGAQVSLRNLPVPGLGLSAFGGHRATFDEKKEIGDWNDLLLGGSLHLDEGQALYLEASYAQRYTAGDLGRRAAALDARSAPHAAVSLVGRGVWDFEGARLSEALLQAAVTPVEQLTVRAEYFVARPTFDRFSFYNYFDVTAYQQLGGDLELRLHPGLELRASYARELFDSSHHADLVGAGATVRPLDALRLTASYQKRFGYGGGLDGLRADGSYRLGDATLFVGADYADFRRDAADPTYGTRDASAKRWWGGAGYQVARWVAVSARAESDLDFAFSHVFKGFVAATFSI